MKSFPAGLSAMLASGVTTLCTCWKVTRRDGAVFGFTDHDRLLKIDGVDYLPETGFTPSAIEISLGLAVDTEEVAGALSADIISEADIALGRWDDADVVQLVVDWTDPANRAVLRAGSIGEVARDELAFSAELRSLAHRLNQRTGRTFSRICDAVLGDSHCRVDLDDPAYLGSGTVVDGGDGLRIIVSGLESFVSGWFARGVLTWSSGANEGGRIELANDAAVGLADPVRTLTLWQRAPLPIEAGDAFTVTAGCLKTWDVCRTKFGNGDNFRGFPHMPGNDFAFGTAKRDGPNDGGSFFR